jgi:glucose/mannose-6-phosphate isomerase
VPFKVNLSEDRLRTLDPQDMLGKTLELPQQIARGWELGADFLRKHPLPVVSELDWFGLGGSAVAGDLLQGFGFEPPMLPLRLNVQRYPRQSSARRMVCSYSGNTVESVRAFEEVPAEQIWMTMSSGGKLQELAAGRNVPHLSVPGGYPPRAAVGFGLGAMMAIFDGLYSLNSLQALQQHCAVLGEAAASYRKLDVERNPALAIAVQLIDKTPVIYTVDGLTMPALATRFRAQLAENSKVWSHASPLPELAHNEVEAFGHLQQLLPPPLVIFLGKWAFNGIFTDPRTGMRKMLEDRSVLCLTLEIDAVDRLATGLQLMLLLDAVTIYLALLRAVEPFEIPNITALKNFPNHS